MHYLKAAGWRYPMPGHWLSIVLLLAPPIHAAVGAGPSSDKHQRSPSSTGAAGLRFGNPTWSPDGRFLALSDDRANGLYLYDLQLRTCLQITDAPSSGYAVNWSADGKKLGFKLLIPTAGSVFPLQVPVVIDLDRRELIALCGPVPRAGVPSFSQNGLTAFTIDQELQVRDQAGRTVTTVPLGHYVNLAAISPDGTRAAYNTADDQVGLVDLATGERRELTSGPHAWFNPVWSPDSNLLVASTVSGRLKSIDTRSGRVNDLDAGSSASWSPDSKTVFYSKTDRIDGVAVLESDLYHIQWDGTGRKRLTGEAGQHEVSGRLSPDGRSIAFVSLSDGGLYRASLTRETAPRDAGSGSPAYSLGSKVRLDEPLAPPAKLENSAAPTYVPSASGQSAPIVAATSVSVSRPVPYLHQVYDTPDSFDGNWACGASSALMAINYFGILPYWDVTCSWPYSHVSHYGRYVSEIYTFNGVTYDYREKDASKNWAYGGYAYIVRDNWADTKGYMRDYIINHGLSSAVDWSPSWAKLQAEVNNDDPCVVLNDLTSAGHYITAIGYYTSQYTGIFNDPYGNKNTPGYPSYDGAGALYDWPGYNNGFQNLNTVWCLIYCRGTLPPYISQQPVSQDVEWHANVSFAVTAAGEGTLSYQWQKGTTDLVNGGHYSGVTTPMLAILAATEEEAGEYRCVVSNAYGSTPSEPATLTVAPQPAAPGDMDRDDDVDQTDFGLLQACLSGPSVPQEQPACRDAHLDRDSDVDQVDMGIFLGCVSGPQVPADWSCGLQ